MWGFDTYLANVIAGGTKRLREINHGHPTDLTNEEWLKILDEISNAFVKYNKEMDEVELYAKENWQERAHGISYRSGFRPFGTNYDS